MNNSGGTIEKTLALAKQVVAELAGKGLYISTVESCTGGGLAYYLTNIPGSSNVLKDSFVAYSTESKIALGVPQSTIDTYTIYSKETALAMAEAGLQKSVRADVAVGITGEISKVVYIAIKYGDKILSRDITVSAEDRVPAKHTVIEAALKMVLEIL